MLTMKDIIREGHPTLSKVAKEIPLPVSEDMKATLFSMLEYIKNSQNEELSKEYQLRPSVGLAAPQINVPYRMLAVHTYDEKNEKLYSYMLINPKMVSHSEELTYIQQGEGCLSVDRDVEGVVLRYKRMTIKAYELKDTGEVIPVSLRLQGYVSIVFQHEIDHLNGILFIDKLNTDDLSEMSESIKPIIFE